MDDTISRKAAINAVKEYCENGCAIAEDKWCPDCQREEFVKLLEKLPHVQPDAIPLDWITEHLEWLDNCENDFAQLARVSIRAMVEVWKKHRTP